MIKTFTLQIIRYLENLKGVSAFLARMVLGIVFFQSGWGKFQNLPAVISYFEELKIPMAHIQAPFVSGLELIGGGLLILGLGTRWISIPLIFTMVVALITAKVPEMETFTDLFGLSEFLYILLFIHLMTEGPSVFSLDHLVKRKNGITNHSY